MKQRETLSLGDLSAQLNERVSNKIDMVVGATAMTSHEGVITIAGAEPELTDDGVTSADGHYVPNDVQLGQIASRLSVPGEYLRRMHRERPDIFDETVNRLIHGVPDRFPGDARKFTFRGYQGDPGVGRALLSPSYKIVDNEDVVTAVLNGILDAGITPDSVATRADLTERRMYLSIQVPEIAAVAPVLTRGYTSPFTGQRGEDLPVVHAGVIIRNSEVGEGAFSITPQVIVQICGNGMTMTKEAMRAVHLGSAKSEGRINLGADTVRREVELVQLRARDAMKTFLDADYLAKVVEGLESEAGKPVEEPLATVERITKTLSITGEHAEGVLNAFIKGGQMTAGGVANAITAYSQTVDDADVAHEINDVAVQAMALV